jgi:rRNA maturation RNase YbeY
MSSGLTLRNRQRTRPVEMRTLRRTLTGLLRELFQQEKFELGFYLVAAPEMTRLNETFLRHQGSTDVIAFDYADPARPGFLAGEVFICVDEAIIQARRFRTTWQSEVVRYAIHGLLHLRGYDDHAPRARARMKREENRLLGLAEGWPE